MGRKKEINNKKVENEEKTRMDKKDQSKKKKVMDRKSESDVMENKESDEKQVMDRKEENSKNEDCESINEANILYNFDFTVHHPGRFSIYRETLERLFGDGEEVNNNEITQSEVTGASSLNKVKQLQLHEANSEVNNQVNEILNAEGIKNNPNEIIVISDEVINIDEVVTNLGVEITNPDEVKINPEALIINLDESINNDDEIKISLDELIFKTEELIIKTEELMLKDSCTSSDVDADDIEEDMCNTIAESNDEENKIFDCTSFTHLETQMETLAEGTSGETSNYAEEPVNESDTAATSLKCSSIMDNFDSSFVSFLYNELDLKLDHAFDNFEYTNEEECTNFTPGSIVWAKAQNFPWFPGLIDDHPVQKRCYVLDETNNIPNAYYVVFFEPFKKACWIQSEYISSFAENQDYFEYKLRESQREEYGETYKIAKNIAIAALSLSHNERILEYGAQIKLHANAKTVVNGSERLLRGAENKSNKGKVLPFNTAPGTSSALPRANTVTSLLPPIASVLPPPNSFLPPSNYAASVSSTTSRDLIVTNIPKETQSAFRPYEWLNYMGTRKARNQDPKYVFDSTLEIESPTKKPQNKLRAKSTSALISEEKHKNLELKRNKSHAAKMLSIEGERTNQGEGVNKCSQTKKGKRKYKKNSMKSDSFKPNSVAQVNVCNASNSSDTTLNSWKSSDCSFEQYYDSPSNIVNKNQANLITGKIYPQEDEKNGKRVSKCKEKVLENQEVNLEKQLNLDKQMTLEVVNVEKQMNLNKIMMLEKQKSLEYQEDNLISSHTSRKIFKKKSLSTYATKQIINEIPSCKKSNKDINNVNVPKTTDLCNSIKVSIDLSRLNFSEILNEHNYSSKLNPVDNLGKTKIKRINTQQESKQDPLVLLNKIDSILKTYALLKEKEKEKVLCQKNENVNKNVNVACVNPKKCENRVNNEALIETKINKSLPVASVLVNKSPMRVKTPQEIQSMTSDIINKLEMCEKNESVRNKIQKRYSRLEALKRVPEKHYVPAQQYANIQSISSKTNILKQSKLATSAQTPNNSPASNPNKTIENSYMYTITNVPIVNNKTNVSKNNEFAVDLNKLAKKLNQVEATLNEVNANEIVADEVASQDINDKLAAAVETHKNLAAHYNMLNNVKLAIKCCQNQLQTDPQIARRLLTKTLDYFPKIAVNSNNSNASLIKDNKGADTCCTISIIGVMVSNGVPPNNVDNASHKMLLANVPTLQKADSHVLGNQALTSGTNVTHNVDKGKNASHKILQLPNIPTLQKADSHVLGNQASTSGDTIRKIILSNVPKPNRQVIATPQTPQIASTSKFIATPTTHKKPATTTPKRPQTASTSYITTVPHNDAIPLTTVTNKRTKTNENRLTYNKCLKTLAGSNKLFGKTPGRKRKLFMEHDLNELADVASPERKYRRISVLAQKNTSESVQFLISPDGKEVNRVELE